MNQEKIDLIARIFTKFGKRVDGKIFSDPDVKIIKSKSGYIKVITNKPIVLLGCFEKEKDEKEFMLKYSIAISKILKCLNKKEQEELMKNISVHTFFKK